jgi:hypothetical protein
LAEVRAKNLYWFNFEELFEQVHSDNKEPTGALSTHAAGRGLWWLSQQDVPTY